jgi:hypothetical protein
MDAIELSAGSASDLGRDNNMNNQSIAPVLLSMFRTANSSVRPYTDDREPWPKPAATWRKPPKGVQS